MSFLSFFQGEKEWVLCDDCETNYGTCCQNRNDLAALATVLNSKNGSAVANAILSWTSSSSSVSVRTDANGRATVHVRREEKEEEEEEVEVTIERDGYITTTVVRCRIQCEKKIDLLATKHSLYYYVGDVLCRYVVTVPLYISLPLPSIYDCRLCR